ncbi:MAG: NAD-dependent epimerase/dehydratase family protein [Muribaculaceae bacterium]|nr:NAD-dependent epimerase/dehydratase family protein [Muribaculaceae bacterium]
MSSLLFTGASGFLGRALLPMMEREYDSIDTLGRSSGCTIRTDLSCDIPRLSRRYDTVLHAAACAHFEPADTAAVKNMFAVNLGGTQRLCEALDRCGLPHSMIFISTVAVYGRVEGKDISENHPLDGRTPYARSKILAESYLTQWCAERGVVLTIIRPPLILGENAPGNLGTMEAGIRRGRYVSLGGGSAVKSFVTPSGIGTLIKLAKNHGGIYNAVDYNLPVASIEAEIAKRNLCPVPRSMPLWIGKAAGMAGSLLHLKTINSAKVRKLTSTLTFSSEKARRELGFRENEV